MKENKGICLKWSSKENDWLFEYQDRAGRTMMGVFFEMLRIEKNIKFLQPSALNNDPAPTLKEMLTERGLDYTTLRITVDKLPENKA